MSVRFNGLLFVFGACLATPLLLPPSAVDACAQLSTGRAAAEAIPPHGYVVASKGSKVRTSQGTTPLS